MPKRFSFCNKEKLSRKKTIDTLFNSGKASLLHPFKVYWMEVDEAFKYPVQVLINVSKKQISKASARNLLKRRIKEAYRLNKHILYDHLKSTNKSLILAYIYISPEILKYKEIEKVLRKSFKVNIDQLL